MLNWRIWRSPSWRSKRLGVADSCVSELIKLTGSDEEAGCLLNNGDDYIDRNFSQVLHHVQKQEMREE